MLIRSSFIRRTTMTTVWIIVIYQPAPRRRTLSSHLDFVLPCLRCRHLVEVYILLRFAWGVAEAKCILVTAVCVPACVCLSVPRRIPTLLHGSGVSWGNAKGCRLVVHYWANLQSVNGFRCYENIAPNAKCQRVLVLALCLTTSSEK